LERLSTAKDAKKGREGREEGVPRDAKKGR
jgi:hypothetical protein